MSGAEQSRPRITIGMPVYNGASFLDQAIDAVLQQSYRDFTILVSDNASTDATWEILQAWSCKDERLVLHRQASNIGPQANFRYVLDLAETPYFMWHAHDDWRDPGYLEALVGILDAEPACSAACGRTVWVAADDRHLRELAFPDVVGLSRGRRISRLLRHASGAWVYGIFRTKDLRAAWGIAESFGYVWGGDCVLVLWFILNDRVRGTNQTAFYGRKTYLSSQAHRPNSVTGWCRFFLRYLSFHFRVLHNSILSPVEKLCCLPRLLIHAVKSSSPIGYGTYERWMKRPLERVRRAARDHALIDVLRRPFRTPRK